MKREDIKYLIDDLLDILKSELNEVAPKIPEHWGEDEVRYLIYDIYKYNTGFKELRGEQLVNFEKDLKDFNI